MVIGFIIFAIFTFTMLFAARNDALTMIISNKISMLLLVCFFLIAPFVWQGWPIFGEHILVGLTVLVFGFTIFSLGWLGGGDAKLMAATAFWWQWSDLGLYIIYTTLAGGVIAMMILGGRAFVPADRLTAPWLHKLVKQEKNMPYGIALAIGALATLPQSEIFKAAVTLTH